jgi:hypothetical protein
MWQQLAFSQLGNAWPWQLHSWQLAAKWHGSSVAGNVAMAAYVLMCNVSMRKYVYVVVMA